MEQLEQDSELLAVEGAGPTSPKCISTRCSRDVCHPAADIGPVTGWINSTERLCARHQVDRGSRLSPLVWCWWSPWSSGEQAGKQAVPGPGSMPVVACLSMLASTGLTRAPVALSSSGVVCYKTSLSRDLN